MKRLNAYLLHMLLLLSSFFCARWFFMRYLYRFSLTFFPSAGETDVIVPLIQVLIITFFLYIFLQSFLTGYIPRWSVFIFYALYIPLLFFVLFLKNIGIKGFEANPFLFIQQFFTLTVLLNSVLFVPLGCLFKLDKRTIIGFFLCILAVESCQFVFSLGIFDVGDIFTNTCGFALGAFSQTTVLGKKLRNRCRDRSRLAGVADR